jgi:hypothetical protein
MMVYEVTNELAQGNHEDGFDPRAVQTRDDLARYLSASLPGDYTTVVGETEIRNVATHVKSYLVETHPDGVLSSESRLATVFDEVSQLSDRNLYRLVDDSQLFFLDTGHPRFQVLHSRAVTKKTDTTFLKLTERDVAGYDHAWLPAAFLRRCQRDQLTGFKFRYATGVSGVTIRGISLDTGEIVDEPLRARNFSMTVSEDAYAEREYDNLVRAHAFEGRKALEQIQFRAANADVAGDFILNSVYASGKLVGKGTSTAGHLLTVALVLDAYERIIQQIETDYALGWVPANGGLVHRGEPFTFWFPPDAEIVDLAEFAGSLFSAKRPFRLFGLPHNVTDRRLDVEAIDLHTGDPLSFEISREWMRVYLPRGSCGNIIARLYSNLQHADECQHYAHGGRGN